jgi:hypothetical protein
LGIAAFGHPAVDSPFSILQNPNDLFSGCFSFDPTITASQTAKEIATSVGVDQSDAGFGVSCFCFFHAQL